jgi:hypothetical protein
MGEAGAATPAIEMTALDDQRACRLALAARLLCAKAEAGRGLSGRELGVGELLFPFGWASLGG